MKGKIGPPIRDPKLNPCPVCGKARGKGTKTEFSHGACMEKRATTEGKEVVTVVIKGERKNFRRESLEKGRSSNAAKRYREGDLPSWMTEK